MNAPRDALQCSMQHVWGTAQHEMRVQVYDYDALGDDDLLGSLHIPMRKLLLSHTPLEGWFKLAAPTSTENPETKFAGLSPCSPALAGCPGALAGLPRWCLDPPIPSRPSPSHPIPSQPIPSHPIPSPPLPSHPSLPPSTSLFLAHTVCPSCPRSLARSVRQRMQCCNEAAMQRGSARCLLRLKRHHAGRANTRQVRAAGREERKMGYGSLPVVARRIRVLVPQFPFPLGPCPTLGVFAEGTSPLLPFLLRPVPTYALFLVPPRPFATPSSGLAHKEWQTLATPRDPSRPARPSEPPCSTAGP